MVHADGATGQALIAPGRKHGRGAPRCSTQLERLGGTPIAHTTMDCVSCGARST